MQPITDILATLNSVDYFIIALLGASTILSFIRGGMREFFSLLAWVASPIIAYYSLDILTPEVSKIIRIDWLSEAVAFIGVFVILYIIFFFTGRYISTVLSESSFALFDKFIGLLFGLLRGVLIISLLYIGALWFWDDSPIPSAMQDARSTPHIAAVAQFIIDMLPPTNTDGQDGFLEDLKNLNLSAPTTSTPPSSILDNPPLLSQEKAFDLEELLKKNAPNSQ